MRRIICDEKSMPWSRSSCRNQVSSFGQWHPFTNYQFILSPSGPRAETLMGMNTSLLALLNCIHPLTSVPIHALFKSIAHLTLHDELRPLDPFPGLSWPLFPAQWLHFLSLLSILQLAYWCACSNPACWGCQGWVDCSKTPVPSDCIRRWVDPLQTSAPKATAACGHFHSQGFSWWTPSSLLRTWDKFQSQQWCQIPGVATVSSAQPASPFLSGASNLKGPDKSCG